MLNGIAAERPIIFVTTEQSPSEVTVLLMERGNRKVYVLNLVDYFTETVGLTASQEANTIITNCEDLNSIIMVIAKLQQRMNQRNILLTFDSLTTLYLLN